jgi:hypothetical protein
MTNALPVQVCANHPQVETSLRCNRCEKPICIKCAVLTPTGYRCRECVRGQQKTYDTAQWSDYPLGIGIVLVLSFLGSLLAPIMGFLTIFVAPLVGGVIAEAVRFVTRRRRSITLFRALSAACVLGGLPILGLQVLGLLGVALIGGFSLGGVFGAIWSGVYVALATSTLYYRLSGISINR